MKWGLWTSQALIIMKMELKRYILARRWIGVYLAAFAPVGLLLFNLVIIHFVAVGRRNVPSISDFSEIYAFFYQTFALRLSIVFSCALVFSQLFRGEILEKTLHLYLLTPVRREVIAAGKYLAGVAAMSLLFATSTILTNVLIYMANSSWMTFFLEGDGISNLVRYVAVTVLACMAYGGIFMVAGLCFKNPIVPAVVVGVWEAFYFILPETLQKVTVMHYLQSLLPLIIDRGPFSVVIDPTGAVISIATLLGAAAGLVWISGKILCRTQVTYSSD
jgi:ABC-type transport system involved in multi-copper enzyme maturation permease subunit